MESTFVSVGRTADTGSPSADTGRQCWAQARMRVSETPRDGGASCMEGSIHQRGEVHQQLPRGEQVKTAGLQPRGGVGFGLLPCWWDSGL